ncbi:MAG: glycoside hydrolase family 3 C-terminal domain-containing protein [Bacteroidetes bacterium]|nr:glycoside hydrolase family 3 C-terminal domain-containing protein [Bacteroidota bacterium]
MTTTKIDYLTLNSRNTKEIITVLSDSFIKRLRLIAMSCLIITCVLKGYAQGQTAHTTVDSTFAVLTRESEAVKIIGAIDPAALKVPHVTGPEIWKEPSQPLEARVHDLVRRMSLAEKASQLLADAAPIPRLGIPAYSYRNEGIHGYVARLGYATVFPQVIGMAATWDPALIHEEADAIATEARAHFNDYASKHGGSCIMHEGISLYAPNINIVRDPRWGRGQETYGEDPFLTSQMSVAYIRGLQGDNPKYVKALACAKHFAVYSGPEPLRHVFNATPPDADLYDTYLPAFQADIQEGDAGSVMGSYNALYGVPNCANPFLLTDILRDQWSFKGFVVSDGGAIVDIWAHHKYVKTPEEAVAAALKADCDLFSGAVTNKGKGHYPDRDYAVLAKAVKEGLVSEKEIDRAISLTLAARFRLGLFDPPSLDPYSRITMEQNDTPQNRALALKVAEESIVLLKNGGVLPLNRAKIKRIAVIGPNADAKAMLLGNYDGTPSSVVTILSGIKEVAGKNVEVTYEFGCPLALKNDSSNKPTPEMTAAAVTAAKSADVVIYVGGLSATLENEQRQVPYQGFLGGDRTRIGLPSPQQNLLKALYSTGKPVIFVNCSGSAIAMRWEAKHLPAIIQAWYPGEEGGLAVANVLFGKYDPAGRLPVTFYKSTKQLPPFKDYSMSRSKITSFDDSASRTSCSGKGRTYRYFKGTPLYPFGFGLSYTTFGYSDLNVSRDAAKSGDAVTVSVNVKNTGDMDGEEVVQLYVKDLTSKIYHPIESLEGFDRVSITKGATRTVTIPLVIRSLRDYSLKKSAYVIEPGKYELQVGSSSKDIRLRRTITVE